MQCNLFDSVLFCLLSRAFLTADGMSLALTHNILSVKTVCTFIFFLMLVTLLANTAPPPTLPIYPIQCPPVYQSRVVYPLLTKYCNISLVKY